MDVINCVVVVLLAGAASWVVGLASVEIGQLDGPKVVQRNGKIGILLVSIAGGLLAGFIVNALMGYVVALECMYVGAWSVRVNFDNLYMDISQRLGMSPTVAAYLRRNFDRLADSGKGIIQQDALRQAVAVNGDSHDKAMLEHIISNLAEVAHVIEHRPEVVAVMSATGGSATTVMVPVYGINRQDVDTYEQRLREKYKNWLSASTMSARNGS